MLDELKNLMRCTDASYGMVISYSVSELYHQTRIVNKWQSSAGIVYLEITNPLCRFSFHFSQTGQYKQIDL